MFSQPVHFILERRDISLFPNFKKIQPFNCFLLTCIEGVRLYIKGFPFFFFLNSFAPGYSKKDVKSSIPYLFLPKTNIFYKYPDSHG